MHFVEISQHRYARRQEHNVNLGLAGGETYIGIDAIDVAGGNQARSNRTRDERPDTVLRH